MAKPFGESLIERNLITRDQLQQALQAQLVYGGHLGTCLIEAGFVDERSVGKVLSEVFGVNYATPELLRDVALGVIQVVPKKLAEKHMALPFRLRDRKLDLALTEPGNLLALDEISTATGYRIQPWVSPEVRIVQAMERYYDLPRRTRFIVLSRQLDGDDATADSSSTAGLYIPAGTNLVDEFEDAERAPERRADLGTDRRREAAGVQGCAAHAADDEMQSPTLEEFARRLCAAGTAAELARTVVEHAAHDVTRSILFAVKGPALVHWDSSGIGRAADRLKALSLPLASEPLFSLLLGNLQYKGPLPGDERYRGFYERLELQAPGEVLLQPVYLNDRLVALLYGDAPPGKAIAGDPADYERMARKLALGIDMLLIRKRILAA